MARIFVCPSENTEVVRAGARFAIAAYMNVPVYAAFQEWLGRGEQLTGMWAAWKAGDRKAALAAIPDEVVDDLVVHGSPEPSAARGSSSYFDNGVTTSSLAILPLDPELTHADAVRALAPQRRRLNRRRLMPRCGGGCRLCVVVRAAWRAASWSRISAMWRSPRRRVASSRRNWSGTSGAGSSVSC